MFQDLGKLYKKKSGISNTCKGNKESELFSALKSVSFEVKPSQVFGLLGPNGAGKTTTLSIMTAEETASWGRVSRSGSQLLHFFQDYIEFQILCVLVLSFRSDLIMKCENY